jgi:uncharacterized membrane protein
MSMALPNRPVPEGAILHRVSSTGPTIKGREGDMAESAVSETRPSATAAAVNRITTDDLKTALSKGWDDFRQKPSHLFVIYLVYPVIALVLSRLVFGYEVLPLLFPLAAGFALVGPIAAIGLYELSRRREAGDAMEWRHAFAVVKSPAIRGIETLGLMLALLFVAWLGAAMAIWNLTLGGYVPASVGGFLATVVGSGAGWTLIVVGNAVGAVFALAVLTISVVSFPMMLDRHCDAVTAVKTSVKAVRTNPGPMLAWGGIVAGGLVLGSIPAFVGLAIVLPVLGHATWHLYRATVPR